MRVILKPGGVLLIVGALASLTGLFVFRNSAANTRAVPTVSPVKEPVVPPGSFTSLLTNGDFSASLSPSWKIYNATSTIMKGSVPGGSEQYLRMQFVPKGSHSWSTMLLQKINGTMKKGDRVVFRGWLRSPESVVIFLYVEEDKSPHARSIIRKIELTPQWTEYTLEGKMRGDFGPSEAHFTIHFGVIPGAVAMADFRLENYGQTESDKPLGVEVIRTVAP